MRRPLVARTASTEALINTTILTDYEIRSILTSAASEAESIVAGMGEGRGRQIRSAQVGLANTMAQMWAGVGDATRVGIGDAVDSAADLSARFDLALLQAAGMSGTHWHGSVLATARTGIDSLMARQGRRLSLAQSVYRNNVLSSGQVDRVLNSGLLLGKSAKEIASDVKKFISPTVPGGASYAAMRLARTEVSNAFHETSKRRYGASPWVESVNWRLSGSHPKTDLCNDYANDSPWNVDKVPDIPHPHCLCTIDPRAVSMKKFKQDFDSGKYDDYIDEQLGCERVA
jgi:hypothetical protein